MKRVLLALLLVLALSLQLAAQTTPGAAVQIHEFNDFTASASKQSFNIYGTGNVYHQFTYTVDGTASVMSVVIEGSKNSGTTWSTLGTLTDTGGTNATYTGSYNMFRVTPSWTASTGVILRALYAGSPTVTAKVTSGTAGQVAYFDSGASLTSNAALTFSASTGLATTLPITSTQGAITTTSAPFISHTVTWNDAAVTFEDYLVNVTDTLSNAASLLMNLKVGGTSQFKVSKAGAVTATGLYTGTGLTYTGQITATQGTITDTLPFITHTATWNDAADTFIDDFRNITSTNSAAGSSFAQWQVGGTTAFRVRKDGSLSDTDTFTQTGINITQGRYVTGASATAGRIRFLNNGSSGSLLFESNGAVTTQSGDNPFVRTVASYTASAGSGVFAPLDLAYTLNFGGAQSGTLTGIRVTATETALNSITHNLMDLTTAAGGSKFKVTNGGNVQPTLYGSQTNCADSAGAAACSAAPVGVVVIDAAATTVVVSTTAVTANSRIFIQEDPSIASALGITCNTTVVRTYAVTARTAATSFTITTSAAPVTNPACLNYWVVN